jgi:uncharacterized protein (TIGR03083 family)
MADLVGADDVLAATDVVVSTLEPTIDDAERWAGPAGTLRWSCTATLAHVVDCAFWYAASLARRSTAGIAVSEADPAGPPAILVESLRSGGALLAMAVANAGPDDRGWHLFGSADRSGWAAMGADEILVHGADVAAGLGVAFDPPLDVADHVVRRLFPWAPAGGDPWARLLWANGRADLGDLPASRRWRFHCAPLEEWDGKAPPFERKPQAAP